MFYGSRINAVIVVLCSMAGVPAIQAAQQLSPAQENQQLALHGEAVAQEEGFSIEGVVTTSSPFVVRCEQSEPRTMAARPSIVEEASFAEAMEAEETKESYADFVGSLTAREKLARPQTHPLFIFLDKDEINSESYPVFAEVEVAIQQKAGPIVVSGFTLSTLFNREAYAFKKQFMTTYNFLLDRDSKIVLFEARRLERGKVSKAIQCIVDESINNFDSYQWIIRQLSQDLFLLVPTDYACPGDSLENGLGLNINSMTRIEEIEVNKKHDSIQRYFSARYIEFKAKAAQHAESSALENIESNSLGGQFLHVLRNNILFVPQNQHSWALYLMGHGNFKSTIAGINIRSLDGRVSAFQEMLIFLATKINTKMLIYISCCGAGANEHMAYGDILAASGVQVYPFTIVTGAITDATIKSPVVKNYDGSVQLAIRFDLFVQALKKNHRLAVGSAGETVDDSYRALLEPLFPFEHIFSVGDKKEVIEVCKDGENQDGVMASLPQVRTPHSPVFTPLFDEKVGKVVTITNVMASTREKPLVIDSSVKAILLEAAHVPFTIFFDETVTKIPPFVSVIPGSAVHILTCIRVENENISFTPNSIFGDIKYAQQINKYFHIHQWLGRLDGEYKDIVIEVGFSPEGNIGTSLLAKIYALHTTGIKGQPHNFEAHFNKDEKVAALTKSHGDLMNTIADIRGIFATNERYNRVVREVYAKHKKSLPTYLSEPFAAEKSYRFEKQLKAAVSRLYRIPHLRRLDVPLQVQCEHNEIDERVALEDEQKESALVAKFEQDIVEDEKFERLLAQFKAETDQMMARLALSDEERLREMTAEKENKAASQASEDSSAHAAE